MRDLHFNTTVLRCNAPVAVGTSGIGGGQLSPALDIRDADSAEFLIGYGLTGATGDTTNVVVYESDTATGTFTSVADADLLGTEAAAGKAAGAAASGTTINMFRKVGYRGSKPFLKLRVYGVGHATGLVSACLLKHKLRRGPTAGPGAV